MDIKPLEDTLEQKESDKVGYWLGEIRQVEKLEDNWRKTAHECEQLFEAERREKNEYNVLFSNTETLLPALYNSTPRPVVRRRFKDEDPVAMAACTLVKRVLENLIDDGLGPSASFDDLVTDVAQSALVPGRGVLWFTYDTTIVAVEDDTDLKEEAEEQGTGASAPAEAPKERRERVASERLTAETVPWSKFRMGHASRWAAVPWVSRQHEMTLAELKENFPLELVSQIPLVALSKVGTKGEEDSGSMANANQEGNASVAIIYEIWSKVSRTVIFVARDFPDAILKTAEDPYGLKDFFPTPPPLQFIRRFRSLTPVALYELYRNQAEELNRCTVRINGILRMMKVRGFYDSTMDKMEEVLKSEDGTLMPTDNAAALLGSGKGLDAAIWLFPVEKLVAVLQQLYVAREGIKQVIYEITGIADIMRGSSQASETLGAQQIKTQWGTLRLKRAQRQVAKFVRDSLRLMAELALSKFDIELLKKMTNLNFPTEAEKQKAQMILQQLQSSGMPPPQPGSPEAGQLEQLQAGLAKPSWEQLVQLLQDDEARSFRIDIEVNSTVDLEATEDKELIGEVLNAIAQFLNGVAPLVEQGFMDFSVAKEMLITIVRRFRFGDEIEESLKKMAAPKPKEDPKIESEKMKMAMEQEKHQMDMQRQAQELANEKEKMQMELQMEREKMQMELQMARETMRVDLIMLQQKSAAAQQAHSQKMAQMAMQAAMPAKPAAEGNSKGNIKK